MRALELVKLQESGVIDCKLQDGEKTHDIKLIVEEHTYHQLRAIVRNYPDSRFRFSSVYGGIEGSSEMRGQVSIIHPQWIQRIPFVAPPSFFKQVEQVLQAPQDTLALYKEMPAFEKEAHASELEEDQTSSVPQRRYMPGLDGLRAIAILAVIAYHLHFSFMPGGFLGVTVFFVLSGYLITDLLFFEWDSQGRINLRAFWMRRVKRLLPAMLLVMSVVLIWVSISHQNELFESKGLVLATLLYVSNWWLVFHKVSYFDQFGLSNPLGHFWSLGIEEQFYLLWPFFLIIGLRWVRRRSVLLALMGLGVAFSALMMVLLYQEGHDPSRVYYGTDTRAFSLLLGAGVAVILPSHKVIAHRALKAKRWLNYIATGAFLALLSMMGIWNAYSSYLYHGGMLFISVLTALVIGALVYPKSWMSTLLSFPLLRWIGKRSYGIYLWHYPIIVLTSPVVNTGGINWGRSLLQVAACFLIADLSWRFVEKPILQGRILIPVKGLAQGRLTKRLSLIAGAIFIVTLTYLSVTVAATNDDDAPSADSEAHSAVSRAAVEMSKKAVPSVSDVHDGQERKQGGTNSTADEQEAVTLIGDSLTKDVEPYLKQLIPSAIINGKVGRQMHEAPALLHQLKNKEQLTGKVVIELGTNGAFSKSQLTALIQVLDKKQQIYLINIRVPRPWQDVVNKALSQAAQRYPNVHLINWLSASRGKASYFSEDGVHLTPIGAKSYAQLIKKTVEK
ncbi:acyltransferase [Pullulanibacillus camelliae]|uniref:Acyltransferase n=1 Tax=Pullulanibacillus camelliae TaxID=1707096 RepID=A0A8J2YGM0_9BACL|nr:acyltransferase family protein [Pullulanibacillus camelliae]GGE36760.1 acyltransferase [Pullulanibacillus camelliae]